MSDPNDLEAFLDEAWQHLSRGVADSRSPVRYPTFATVSPVGMPETRMVALRAADRTAGVIEVHTDIATAKIAALTHAPLAALHAWIPRSDLQIRLSLKVEILSGSSVDTQWAKVPQSSRVSYGTEPTPGTPIGHVYAYAKPPNRARFAVLRGHVTAMDLVHLGTKHRRAVFEAADGWSGTWVAP